MYYYVLMCVATLKVLVHLNPFTNTKQFRVCCKTMLNKLIDIGE